MLKFLVIRYKLIWQDLLRSESVPKVFINT